MDSQRLRRQLFLMPGLLLAGSLIIYQVIDRKNTVKADIHDQKQVERGHHVYDQFCARCHGKELEGQPEWRIRKPDGKLPAPPHDGTGHTWHHPDDTLFEIIKRGLIPPHAPDGYLSDMPAWEGTLTDEDIWAVLAYIKSRWPEEMQKFQEDINTRAQR
jgi:mono/diheme cytochrome c family protein